MSVHQHKKDNPDLTIQQKNLVEENLHGDYGLMPDPEQLKTDKRAALWKYIENLVKFSKLPIVDVYRSAVALFGKENVPHYDIITKTCRENEWIDGEYEELIEEKRKKTNVEIMAELGKDHRERLKLLADMMDKAEDVFKIIGKLTNQLEHMSEDERIKMLKKIGYNSLMSTYSNTAKLALNALQESFKLCGDYSPEKMQHTIKDRSGSRTYENMDAEEQKLELMRLAKLKSEATGIPLETFKKMFGLE